MAVRRPACTKRAAEPVDGRTRCGLAKGHPPPCRVREDHYLAPLVPDVVGTPAELAAVGEVIPLNDWHAFVRTPSGRLLAARYDGQQQLC